MQNKHGKNLISLPFILPVDNIAIILHQSHFVIDNTANCINHIEPKILAYKKPPRYSFLMSFKDYLEYFRM